MPEELYKTGDYVELRLLSGRKGNPSAETSVVSESIITGTLPGNVLRITIPTQRGRSCPVEEGEVYELRFIASSGSFSCRAEVIDDPELEYGSGFALQLISELSKDSKRLFYRLEKVIPLMYSIGEEESGQMLGGTCFNISAGGVRFSSGTDIERGRIIRMTLMISDDDNGITIPGRVIYTDNVGLEDAVYEHRVEFCDISPDIKERIVRYCFDEACK